MIRSGRDYRHYLSSKPDIVVLYGGLLRRLLTKNFMKRGYLEDACSLFEKLPGRSIIAWTATIAGYAQHGMGEEVIHVYHKMQ